MRRTQKGGGMLKREGMVVKGSFRREGPGGQFRPNQPRKEWAERAALASKEAYGVDAGGAKRR